MRKGIDCSFAFHLPLFFFSICECVMQVEGTHFLIVKVDEGLFIFGAGIPFFYAYWVERRGKAEQMRKESSYFFLMF